MKSYYESMSNQHTTVGFDLYTDSTQMSSSGSQSICILLVRFVNIKGFSNLWYEIGIARSFSGDRNSTLQNQKFFAQSYSRDILTYFSTMRYKAL